MGYALHGLGAVRQIGIYMFIGSSIARHCTQTPRKSWLHHTSHHSTHTRSMNANFLHFSFVRLFAHRFQGSIGMVDRLLLLQKKNVSRRVWSTESVWSNAYLMICLGQTDTTTECHQNCVNFGEESKMGYITNRLSGDNLILCNNTFLSLFSTEHEFLLAGRINKWFQAQANCGKALGSTCFGWHCAGIHWTKWTECVDRF